MLDVQIFLYQIKSSMKKIGLLSSILLCSLLCAQSDKTKILTEISEKIKENYIDEKVFKSIDSLFQN